MVKQAGIVTLDCLRWGGFQHTDGFRQTHGPGQNRTSEFQTVPINDQGTAGTFDRNLGAQYVGLRDLTDTKPDVCPFQFLLGELQSILRNLDLGLKPQHLVIGLGNAEQHATNGELVALLLLSNRVFAESPRREKRGFNQRLGDLKRAQPVVPRTDNRGAAKKTARFRRSIKGDLIFIAGVGPPDFSTWRHQCHRPPRQEFRFCQLARRYGDLLLVDNSQLVGLFQGDHPTRTLGQRMDGHTRSGRGLLRVRLLRRVCLHIGLRRGIRRRHFRRYDWCVCGRRSPLLFDTNDSLFRLSWSVSPRGFFCGRAN